MPDCSNLTDRQLQAVLGYLEDDGRVTVVGPLGGGDPSLAEQLRAHPQVRSVPAEAQVEVDLLCPETPQVQVWGSEDVGTNLHLLGDGSAALHLVNYDYDERLDRTRRAGRVVVRLRAAALPSEAVLRTPGQEPLTVPVEVVGEGLGEFVCPELGCYLVVQLPGYRPPGTGTSTTPVLSGWSNSS